MGDLLDTVRIAKTNIISTTYKSTHWTTPEAFATHRRDVHNDTKPVKGPKKGNRKQSSQHKSIPQQTKALLFAPLSKQRWPIPS